MAQRFYYSFQSGVEHVMDSYNIDTNSFLTVGDNFNSDDVLGESSAEWCHNGSFKFKHDSMIGMFRGQLTACIINSANNRLYIAQLDRSQGANGAWIAKTFGNITLNSSRPIVFLRVFDDKLYVFASIDFDSSGGNRNKHFIYSWDGVSSTMTIEQDFIFFNKFSNLFHVFEPLKIGDSFYCGVSNGVGRIPENNILEYNPKTNTLSSGEFDYDSFLSNQGIDDSYFAASSPVRVPGTTEFLFLTDTSTGSTGQYDIISVDVVSGAIRKIFVDNTFNHSMVDTSSSNSAVLLGVENASGVFDNDNVGVYHYRVQGNSGEDAMFNKWTKNDVDQGFENASVELDISVIQSDFSYSTAADRAAGRHNYVSDGEKIYISHGNTDTSGPGPLLPHIYEFDPTTGSTAVYTNGSGVALYPSGSATLLGIVPSTRAAFGDEIRESFTYDLENNIDVLVAASGISTSGVATIVPYTLFNEASASGNMLPMYSLDLGATWNEATDAAGGDGRSNLTSAPSGDSHIYHWAARSDIVESQKESLMFRIVML